jgi:hypothetical protein
MVEPFYRSHGPPIQDVIMKSTPFAPRQVRMTLESLDSRDVPSATLDVTARGSGGTVNAALFQQTDAQPTGTGLISSFVRVQGTGVEGGYNTDARPLQFQENSSPKFTRSLHLSDVPVSVVDGIGYRQFLLDINQNSASPLLSLDDLKIFVGDRGNLTGYDKGTGTLAGLHAAYDLDAAGDATVLMNASLNHGSGSGDLAVFIPDALFGSASADPFVYLYSAFGKTAGAAANGGFEEWAVLPKTDVSALGSLSGRVYFDANTNGVYDSGDSGLQGVSITLTGTDDRGQEVYLTTVTDADGNYFFASLRPGTYTITETQPANYEDGSDSVGSLGGNVGNDLFTDIILRAGRNGVGYNFGEGWQLG